MWRSGRVPLACRATPLCSLAATQWFRDGQGIILGDQMGRIRFFDNPSTIVNNTNGRYPQGFQTPGAVASMGYGEGVFCGCTWQRGGPGDSRILGMKGVSGYFQDDWRVVPRVT